MSELKGIPVVLSGSKVEKPHGFRAVKNGVKASKSAAPVARGDKPDWLRVKIPTGGTYQKVRKTVREHRLATVRLNRPAVGVARFDRDFEATVGHLLGEAGGLQFSFVDYAAVRVEPGADDLADVRLTVERVDRRALQ